MVVWAGVGGSLSGAAHDTVVDGSTGFSAHGVSLTLAAMNGVLFGAVHLPDVELTVLTSVGGAVWSWYYLRDRCLAPIAVSHAVLGTTYYYWIRGDDLLLRWFSATRW